MSHLARVNRWLYQVLDPILYMMDAKPYNQYALFWAAEHNLLTVAERALRAGTPVQPHNDVPSPLRPFGRILTEQELKAATKFSNFSRRTTPLDIVAGAGHCAIAALLLRDPRLIRSFDVELAIHSAAANDREEMVDMLLWHVEQVHKECMSHMIGCAFTGAGLHQSVAVLKLLVENGTRLAFISRERYSLYQMNYAGTGHDELWDLFSSIRPLELVPDHRIQRQDLRSNLTARVTGKGSRGIVELVKTFTRLGFDWMCKGELAWMLRMALRRDNVPLMELLLSYSSDEQNELEKLVAVICLRFRLGPKVCGWLLARGCRPGVWDRAFAGAIKERDIKEARVLLSMVDGIPASIRYRGGEMLEAACSMNFPELAQLVLSPRSTAERRKLVQDAEPKLTRKRSLLISFMNPRPEGQEICLETARLVLEAGADPNSKTSWSESPLKTACEKGMPRLARLLLKHGANSLQATPNGLTILHIACRYCPNLAFIEELLERGADVMARCGLGTTPLHQLCYASSNEKEMGPMARYQVARLLISKGADPNVADELGTTSLHFACSNGSLSEMGPEDAKVVVVLLEHGVDIEQPNGSDERPLFVACSSLNHSVASILLENGADRSRETLRGFAKRYLGFHLHASLDAYAHEMVKLLLFHGVDRVFVTEEVMDFGYSGRLYETFRLLLMHGVDVEIDKLPFRNKKRPSRTKNLAEALAWDTRM
ncbi:hypothetical protein BB8028_0007g03090 [Beauveria bassiana]|uniref:Uncharacterized protein n=1 Tax=Beauveria bassiana TaxID=176275 RepID=A0A2S7YLP3_BEABA|nr:hypothetical protein BB8028_0007g03090 [Beauveria bassiana]